MERREVKREGKNGRKNQRIGKTKEMQETGGKGEGKRENVEGKSRGGKEVG